MRVTHRERLFTPTRACVCVCLCVIFIRMIFFERAGDAVKTVLNNQNSLRFVFGVPNDIYIYFLMYSLKLIVVVSFHLSFYYQPHKYWNALRLPPKIQTFPGVFHRPRRCIFKEKKQPNHSSPRPKMGGHSTLPNNFFFCF